MKALFFNLPFYGHVDPTLPLVAELVRRGEQVTYVTSAAFQTRIEEIGAEFLDIGEQDAAFDLERDNNIFLSARRLIQPVHKAIDALLPVLRADPPDYVLHDSAAIWGPALATLLDVPAISSVPTIVFTPRLSRTSLRWIGPTARRPVLSVREIVRFRRLANELVRDYHLPRQRITSVFSSYGPLNIVFVSRSFQPFADDVDDRFKFVGRVIDTGQSSWDPVLEGLGHRPIVYVSLGTMASNQPEFFHTCFAAFAGLDCDVVITAGRRMDASTLGTPPANVRVANWVDQAAVLQRAALVVCHGGTGTVNEALAFGVPMLLVPQFGEQFWTAARVQELGAGIMVAREQVSAERLRTSAARVLGDPSYAAASRRLGDSLREAGGHVRAADEILNYVRHVTAPQVPVG